MHQAALALALLAAGHGDHTTLFGEPLVGRDKALHFAGSATLSVAGYAAAAAALDEPWQRALVGAGVAAAAGVAKEGVDALGAGTPSLIDLVYDAFGIMVGTGVALAFDAAVTPPARAAE